MNKKQKIILASDHAGFKLKEQFKKYFLEKHYQVEDLGPIDDLKSSSYATQGKKLGQYIQSHPQELGIGICGTGIGISLAVNRFKKVRGARVTSVKDAKLARQHNDANVLLFGGRQISFKKALKIFKKFEKSQFEKGRHSKRIKELD